MQASTSASAPAAIPVRPSFDDFPTIEQYVGDTPLVRLQRLAVPGTSNVILAKLEGNNPAGSVKDRPALNMINVSKTANVSASHAQLRCLLVKNAWALAPALTCDQLEYWPSQVSLPSPIRRL